MVQVLSDSFPSYELAFHALEVKYKVSSERIVRAQVKQGRIKHCGSSEAFAWNCQKQKREKEREEEGEEAEGMLKKIVGMMVKDTYREVLGDPNNVKTIATNLSQGM
ncbi:hypothetical protein M0802_008844 [Mischocyttarus mexicanus]|nr:hypothetical protein M0802_008844 [Mischocyttarus mexicanus]